MSRPPLHQLLLALAFSLTLVPALTAQQPGRYGHYDVFDPDLPPREEYAARRAEAMKRMSHGSAMLLMAAQERTRSNDTYYPFRQDNSLLYLSGVAETESALLLVPDSIEIDGQKVREVLFVAERDPSRELWTGLRMGPEMADTIMGVAMALPISRLEEVMGDVKQRCDKLWLDSPDNSWPGRDDAAPGSPRRRNRSLNVAEADDILGEMRTIKSQVEIGLLRKAIDISVIAHRETIRRAKPNMHEYELEAIMEGEFTRLGSENPGYPSIVGSGPMSCILHYETNRRPARDGDLVLMDCGAEYHGYTADVTRTIPLNGKFSEAQRAIYNLVLEAQDSGIAACRAGSSFMSGHFRAMSVISRGLMKLGITRSEGQASRYFMHGTSHYIGLDVHDIGPVGALVPGMVMTVEPGIYIPEGSPCDKKWWNIGVRIEDDILITEEGPVNLSGALERTAEQIEGLMGK